jgi:hypothetical protein
MKIAILVLLLALIPFAFILKVFFWCWILKQIDRM